MLKANKIRVLVIDNYDSFTYNLVHLVEQIADDFTVVRNDAFELDDAEVFSHIVIGPGPGLPEESGLVMQLIEQYGSSKSILGICLGMQALLVSDGSVMLNMSSVKHGAQDSITTAPESKLFINIPKTITVGRYHSWAFKSDVITENYRVTALSDDGHVMAVEHKTLPLFGLQFHPESIMTEHGLKMIQNWMSVIYII